MRDEPAGEEPTTDELPGIPHAARAHWRELLAEDLAPVHELFNEVKRYQALIEADAADGPPSIPSQAVDPIVVRDLTRASLELLRTIGPATPESTRRLIQAAVRYFVRDDDGDPDLDSVLGFDDDAEVMNAVLAHLGHREWLIELP